VRSVELKSRCSRSCRRPPAHRRDEHGGRSRWSKGFPRPPRNPEAVRVPPRRHHSPSSGRSDRAEASGIQDPLDRVDPGHRLLCSTSWPPPGRHRVGRGAGAGAGARISAWPCSSRSHSTSSKAGAQPRAAPSSCSSCAASILQAAAFRSSRRTTHQARGPGRPTEGLRAGRCSCRRPCASFTPRPNG
jgi:hypothetical protein